MFGKIRTDTAVADRVISEFNMKNLSAMFISHSHHDHVMDMPYFANACGCDVYGSESTMNVARGGGVPDSQLKPFRDRAVYTIGDFTITVLSSIHSKPNAFNNDLGKTIDRPLNQPARRSAYREGGSYDFLVEHGGKRYLIRPSYNFIPNQLTGIQADVLFLGIAGISKDDAEHKQLFWQETVEKVKPELIIPLHWDNFFTPLYGPVKGMPKLFEDTGRSLHELAAYCAEKGIACSVQLPLTTLEI